MSAENHEPPRRLIDTPGQAGECLRRALAEQGMLPSPPPFSALRERRLQRARRPVAWSFAVVAALALTFTAERLLHHREDTLSVRAEVLEVASPERELRPATEAQAPSASELPSKPLVERSEVPRAKPRLAPAPAEPQTITELPPKPAPAEAAGGARACAELARAGAAEPALACYAQLASGRGTIAELALFEQARLEGKALRRPDRALATLEDYRRRFPNGSLRAEVMLARIDWLLKSNDHAGALQAVDEALASDLLGERGAELERLRATLVRPATSH